MCGITGICDVLHRPIDRSLLTRMTQVLTHRGPDDEGYYVKRAIGLGHRRLSILDLSTDGHQPMCNEDGTIWLVYNGEIYNYQEMASDLRAMGHVFRSRTDTEVILHAYEQFGVDCLSHFNGMWAFAIWDERRRRLFCARDRLGIKQLYYHFDGYRYVFASEIKALLLCKDVPRQPNEPIVYDYLVHGLVDHTDDTFFAHVKQLPAGHFQVVENGQVQVSRYWSLDPEHRIDGLSDDKAAARFCDLFEDSVRLRLQSDVPVGTCFSGGLDSTSIVCMIARLQGDDHLPNPTAVGERQKTFSSCFEDERFDERAFIGAVVDQTGVDAHYVFPKGEELFEDIGRFIWHQDEPVVGTSQYAQWCVMRLVRSQGVTVVLDGQGGDELLAGYHLFFYSLFKDLARAFQWRMLAREVECFSKRHGHSYSKSLAALDALRQFVPEPVLRLRRRLLGREEADDLPRWIDRNFASRQRRELNYTPKYDGRLAQQLYRFLVRDRLPSLLRYEDRNSMAFSVEARLPFLDHRLVEFACALPNEQKIRNGVTKVVLRNAMRDVIPEVVRQRMDKKGFVTPEAIWFRTVCASKITEVFASNSFRQRPYFDSAVVQDHWQTFLETGEGDSAVFWRCLNLELWLREFFDAGRQSSV